MTLKNNRAPLLCCFQLCAWFHCHMWIQTGVRVRKRLSWVLTSVTLTFDLWPWPFAWTSLLTMVITPENFMMIRWWEHGEKGVTDRPTDGQTDGQTENTICRAAWSQLKTHNTLHSCHNFPAGSRQAARGAHICETSLLSQIRCDGASYSHLEPVGFWSRFVDFRIFGAILPNETGQIWCFRSLSWEVWKVCPKLGMVTSMIAYNWTPTPVDFLNSHWTEVIFGRRLWSGVLAISVNTVES